MIDYRIGDGRDLIAQVPDGCVDLVACSPPFLALRSYLPADHEHKHAEIGSEPDPATFLDTLLGLTAEWGRVLAPHGSIAIELGDSYYGSGGAGGDYAEGGIRDGQATFRQQRVEWGVGRKSLALIPQLYATSLAYGRNLLTGQESPAGQWLVRNVIVWHRPNPAVGALGDKFRPSTSYIVVATKSPKRWFDLTAVRTEHVKGDAKPGSTNGPKAATPSDDHGRGTYGFTERTTNPAGAPPLDCWTDEHDHHDTWTLTTQPSKLAHYAMWPAKLAERLVLSMCPAEVCVVCGEPRRRIEGVRPWPKRDTDPLINDGGRGGGAHGNRCAPDTTLGWTDCGCNVLRCIPCNVLVPSGDAVRRPREEPSGQPGVGQAPLLAESIEGQGGQEAIPPSVRGVPDRVHGQDANGAVLHSELLGEAGAHRGSGQLAGGCGAEESAMEGRQTASRWVSDGLGSAGDAGPAEVRLHDGTPASHAGPHRPAVGIVGDCPSPERGEGRQSGGEPGDSHARQARRNGDVPPLPDGVSGQLTCPHCAGALSVVSFYRPGLVLEPFAGTGTTCCVAELHGRDSVGFDIDSRNRELLPRRMEEVRRNLFGTKPEQPGQLDLWGAA